MPLKLLPAGPRDADQSIHIETLAYGPNPIGPIIYPGPFPPSAPDAPNPRVEKLVSQLEADPACKWVKVIDTELPEERNMVAFSMWFFWTEPQHKAQNDTPVDYGTGSNWEACDYFFGEMRRRQGERFEGRPYAYLKLLHTDPAHQGRGAASMLLRWGAEEADRLGLDSYLESSPDAARWYAKRGFVEVDLFNADFSKWNGPKEHPSALMVRPVTKSS
ncbi:putative GNAT family acetyltransferase [Emericellopsis atlantica]|uniref:GNAT family acetyltransferase n=1 Tax=Emericellopsis atlantica TaxID=2614577 RepID=A0A9P8CRX4_9HYPO|nr:putative GNAT family acetyltransferase [Emericellopsis atlantica]KAG9256797.1 putative GNAT family acetyltransferase [Emericellopsis atlantica]